MHGRTPTAGSEVEARSTNSAGSRAGPQAVPLGEQGPATVRAKTIETEELNLYYGDFHAVADVSLTIEPHKVTALIGSSGCGKTTFLRSLNRMHELVPGARVAGRITLDGRPITDPGPDRGVIFQEYAVFPWLSVQDNIAFGLGLRANRVPPAERNAIVDRYVRFMGLEGFERAWPRTLSGGMKQRVALARAYAVKSEFLLMDEPFGALDAQTRTAMQNLLLDVLEKEGKTVLFITHAVEEALYLSSRIVVVTARPARIRHVVGDCAQIRVAQSDAGRTRIDEREVVVLAPVGVLEDRARRSAARSMRRRVAGKARRDHIRLVVGVCRGPRVAVFIGARDRRFRSPRPVQIF